MVKVAGVAHQEGLIPLLLVIRCWFADYSFKATAKQLFGVCLPLRSINLYLTQTDNNEKMEELVALLREPIGEIKLTVEIIFKSIQGLFRITVPEQYILTNTYM